MCGIFGIINTKVKHFDYQTFCTLGICNDDRGGDSCGVFIDGQAEYGVDKQKLFADFVKTSKLLNDTSNARIALGHCRKASVGIIDESTAQPVILYENGKPVFVLIHNGTIFNYDDLAKKYIPDVDITGLTDSQVMARIFYYKGYDVLAEYNGGSVFVVVDYRKEEPLILMFKGESLISFGNVVSEERPLYLVFGKDNITFSSIPKYLKCKKDSGELYTLQANHLIKVTDKCRLELVKEYDRTSQYQIRVSNYKYLDDDYYRKYYGYYDYGKHYTGGHTGGNNSNNNNQDKSNYRLNEFSLANNNKRVITSKDDGTYFIDGALAHGFYYINKDGEVVNSSKYDKASNSIHVFFFWQGVLLYNKECYKFLKKLCRKEHITEGELMEEYFLLVHSLSPDPFKDDQQFNDTRMYYAISHEDFDVFCNQQWQYFMSKNCYWFDECGNISADWESDMLGVKSTFDDYCRIIDRKTIDFSELIDIYKVY